MSDNCDSLNRRMDVLSSENSRIKARVSNLKIYFNHTKTKKTLSSEENQELRADNKKMREELDYVRKLFLEFQIESQKDRKTDDKVIQYRRKSE